MLNKVDKSLASGIAEGLGMKVPSSIEGRVNQAVGADAGRATESKPMKNTYGKSPALSMMNTVKDTIRTRRIAFLVADGVDDNDLSTMKNALTKEGAMVKIIGPRGGTLKSAKGAEIKVDMSLVNASSVLFDATYVPGGARSAADLKENNRAILFVNETYKHCKAIAATGHGVLRASAIDLKSVQSDPALLGDENGDAKKVSAKFKGDCSTSQLGSREDGEYSGLTSLSRGTARNATLSQRGSVAFQTSQSCQYSAKASSG
jgi:catalase